ncbi:hypothetical protein ACH4UT_19145 [Streptomyces sp. NPDC020799]
MPRPLPYGRLRSLEPADIPRENARTHDGRAEWIRAHLDAHVAAAAQRP